MQLTVDQTLQQGVAAHKEGKLQEAERLYRAILQTQPTHADANHNLGVLAVNLNNYEVALPLFKTAVESDPNIEQFWVSYIDALIKENQFEDAKRALKNVKKFGLSKNRISALTQQFTSKIKNPAPTQSQIQTLLDHYQKERFDDAEKLAISITDQFPDNQVSWKVLAATLKKTGKIFDALATSQKLVAMAPKDAEAHSNLGNTLKELGKLEEAEASFRQAIAINQGFAEAHSNLGNTLNDLSRLEEAEKSCKKAIEIKPDFAEAHSNLGNTLKELGRLEAAEESYAKAIEIKPDFAEAHNNLGNTLNDLGRLEEAEKSYKQAIEIKPDFAEAHSNLGNTLNDLGKLEEAEKSCKKAIALQPNYAEAYYNLGNTLQELKQLDLALANYEKAISLKKDFDISIAASGNVLMKKGKHKEGLNKLRIGNGSISFDIENGLSIQ